MADGKAKNNKKPAEDEELVKRVDDMMAPGMKRNPNPPPPQGPYQPKSAEEITTAPPLGEVYKPKGTSKPPIVIQLAGEDEPAQKSPQAASPPPIASQGALADTKLVAIAPAQTPQVTPQPPVPSPDSTDSTPFDDQKTDAAVDDIAKKDSDTILAIEDARAARRSRAQVANSQSGWKAKLQAFFKNKWTWAGIVIILLLVLAIPYTRYKILGLVIKKNVVVTVLDSKTGTPVSNAQVLLGGGSAKTNGEGLANVKAALGEHNLIVSKQYYKSLKVNYTVGFKSDQTASEKLVATGRLVPITVSNKITGQPLKDAQIKVHGTIAKTNGQGRASIALPADASVDQARVSLNGFNTTTVSLQVTNQAVKLNDFLLTPTGHIFFLSNASGTIDVVRTNLDGSGRTTILAGTGHESATSTVLLASRDWRYLVLEANRDGSSPALYLIDANSGKSTEFEDSGATIKLIGWYGHNFIYDLTKDSQSRWQSGREILKSYDADNQQTNQLDQDQATGSANAYAYQSFDNFYIVDGGVVYTTEWSPYATDGSDQTAGKSNTIRFIGSTGQSKKDYESFSADTTSYIQSQQFSPQGIYFAVYNSNDGSTTYYQYQDQSAKTASIDNGTFSATYPTYLISPSGNHTFWTELVDGQNSLFIGAADASSKKQVSSSGDYTPYGWYSENYLLVSKNSSQLYIIPTSGLSGGRQPLKITDYYKPAQTFDNYGYGYGGGI